MSRQPLLTEVEHIFQQIAEFIPVGGVHLSAGRKQLSRIAPTLSGTVYLLPIASLQSRPHHCAAAVIKSDHVQQRVNIAAAHNQVIEDFDINHPQHLRQTLGDQLVSGWVQC